MTSLCRIINRANEHPEQRAADVVSRSNDDVFIQYAFDPLRPTGLRRNTIPSTPTVRMMGFMLNPKRIGGLPRRQP